MLSVVLLMGPVAMYAAAGFLLRWNSDDAFINYRVVDQLLAGNGPVFNAGERVEIYTSALWLAILAALAALPGPDVAWIGVAVGLALAAGGLAAAAYAAALLHGWRPGVVALPLGALTFAALPPAWDFATSGLETGLSFAWLAGTYLGLVVLDRTSRDEAAHGRGRLLASPRALAVLAGLGPLVRPDFAIFSVAFFVVLVALHRRRLGPWVLRLGLIGIAAPLAYQVLRMGYFAALVPNTAIAKEAGASDWARGWTYVRDTLGTYWLVVPVAALLAWLAASLRARDTPRLLLRAMPVAAGVLHLAFVAKVGGDFMHGRLLLPGVFALLLPVAAVPVAGARRLAVGAGVVVAAWAVVTITSLRPAYDETPIVSPDGIADERAFYADAAGVGNPVSVEDFRRFAWAASGFALRDRARRGERVVSFAAPNFPPASGEMPAVPGLPQPIVAGATNVGLAGYAAGPDVRIVDRFGLGDPFAARAARNTEGRPGHLKVMSPEWVLARFGDPGAPLPRGVDPAGVAAARRALRCGALRRVVVDVASPMTLRRFVANVAHAPGNSRARWPQDPAAAARRLCTAG